MSNLKVTYIALVPAITPTFMRGFQNNLAQLFSLRSSSAIWNIFFRYVEGQGHT